jgi:hypothetical protein
MPREEVRMADRLVLPVSLQKIQTFESSRTHMSRDVMEYIYRGNQKHMTYT